jgi:sialidase-1
MTIRGSLDDGATWPLVCTLHEGSSAYSCLVALPGDDIGCLYEADGYHRIVFARISRSDLLEEASISR